MVGESLIKMIEDCCKPCLMTTSTLMLLRMKNITSAMLITSSYQPIYVNTHSIFHILITYLNLVLRSLLDSTQMQTSPGISMKLTYYCNHCWNVHRHWEKKVGRVNHHNSKYKHLFQPFSMKILSHLSSTPRQLSTSSLSFTKNQWTLFSIKR